MLIDFNISQKYHKQTNPTHKRYEEKFESYKAMLGYYMSLPGKKLLFMGGEFGQFVEWRFAEGLDWQLLDYEFHRGIKEFAKDLGEFYKSNRSMYENDYDWKGFNWITADDSERSVVAFMRQSKSGRDKTIVVANFAAQEHKGYEVKVPGAGNYEVVLSTNDKKYGGNGKNTKSVKAKRDKDGYSIKIDITEL